MPKSCPISQEMGASNHRKFEAKCRLRLRAGRALDLHRYIGHPAHRAEQIGGQGDQRQQCSAKPTGLTEH